MPEEAEDIPSSFTQIGHIAHMNLKDYYQPWKKLIGEVILDVKTYQSPFPFSFQLISFLYRKIRILKPLSTR